MEEVGLGMTLEVGSLEKWKGYGHIDLDGMGWRFYYVF
jgi:hypothetical protein